MKNGGPSLGEIDQVIIAYVERYGDRAKPSKILLACRETYLKARPAKNLVDDLISVVWRTELSRTPKARRHGEIVRLRNSFSVNKRVLNRRLVELSHEGKNPLGIGLTTDNIFDVIGEGIEKLARREESRWITEHLSFELNIIDAHRSTMTKKERLIPLVRGLTSHVHSILSDGEVQILAAHPGNIYRLQKKLGTLEAVHTFDSVVPNNGIDLELKYSETDAYRNAREYFRYTCIIPTRGDVTFVAHFAKDRPATEATAYLVGAAWDPVPLPPEGQPRLFIDASGHHLSWRIPRPKYRQVYEVAWYW